MVLRNRKVYHQPCQVKLQQKKRMCFWSTQVLCNNTFLEKVCMWCPQHARDGI